MRLLRIKTPDYLPRASDLRRRGGRDDRAAPGAQGRLSTPGQRLLRSPEVSRFREALRAGHEPMARPEGGAFTATPTPASSGTSATSSSGTAIGKGTRFPGTPRSDGADPPGTSRTRAWSPATIQETLSIYCGGIDNLYRHHDYSIAILESLRPYPMARFWLHGHHLFVGGKKMSKSRGNILLHRRPSRPGIYRRRDPLLPHRRPLPGKALLYGQGHEVGGGKAEEPPERVREIAEEGGRVGAAGG